MRHYGKVLRPFTRTKRIWGFIDGTWLGCSRPVKQQKKAYSGYKKGHGVKYQGIVGPDGLLISISGPYLGEINDLRMVQLSRLEEQLREIFIGLRKPLFLYGDQAYTHQYGILPPYDEGGVGFGRAERRFNRCMASARIAVENCFGLTRNLWAKESYKNSLKIGESAVGSEYLIAVLLANCYTCIRGNCVGKRFLCDPPLVEEYLLIEDD
jgi:hypothetical protein